MVKRAEGRQLAFQALPLLGRRHASEQPLEVADPDADDPAPGPEGGKVARGNPTTQRVDTDAEDVCGLGQRDEGAGPRTQPRSCVRSRAT